MVSAKDKAKKALSEGTSPAEVARRYGFTPRAVQNWARELREERERMQHDPNPERERRRRRALKGPVPSTPGAVGVVHDEDPSELWKRQPELDPEAFERANGPTAPPTEPEEQPERPPLVMKPEECVDACGAILGMALRMFAKAKKLEWAPEMNDAAKFTPEERSALVGSITPCMPMLERFFANAEYVAVGMFCLTLSGVTMTRIDEVSAIARKKRPGTNFGGEPKRALDDRTEPAPVVPTHVGVPTPDRWAHPDETA